MNTLTRLFPTDEPLAAQHPDAQPAIDRKVLEAAAEWYVQSRMEQIDHAALDRWRHADAAHERAWQLVQQMDRHLADMPAALALPALKVGSQRRRAVMKTLAVLVAAGGTGWLTVRTPTWQGWTADYRTAPGERRQITLVDGGVVDLNTDTALDVRYDHQLRLMHLHHGEIMVRTAPDSQGAGSLSRPFIVQTPHGRLRALGTRFDVRADAIRTRLAVYEHAVEITMSDKRTLRVEAGQQAEFSADMLSAAQPLSRNQDAWTRGMLVAVDQRLDDFLKELSRYRRGRLLCDPAVAGLRVTGAWRLDDIDATLASLTASHPVQLRYYTRFWVVVEPGTSG